MIASARPVMVAGAPAPRELGQVRQVRQLPQHDPDRLGVLVLVLARHRADAGCDRHGSDPRRGRLAHVTPGYLLVPRGLQRRWVQQVTGRYKRAADRSVAEMVADPTTRVPS